MSLNRFLERLPLALDRPWIGYAAALAMSAVALLLRISIDGTMPFGFPYVTFFPAVILSSFLFGLGPGIFAAILCGLAAWYVFIPPYWSFELQRGTWIAIALYGFVVTVDIVLIHWMQRATARLRAERQRGEELAAHAELLFHELQHRVSNNLQMIGSVLSLQRRHVTDSAAAQALGDAVAKLQSIGRIQRQLTRLTARISRSTASCPTSRSISSRPAAAPASPAPWRASRMFNSNRTLRSRSR